MRTIEKEIAFRLVRRFSIPKTKERPSKWVEKNISFNEPAVRGPFSFSGREYGRACVDDWGDEENSSFVYVMGTGSGKTVFMMAGKGWRIIHKPMRCLCVRPTTYGAGGAKNFSKSRFRKMLEASKVINDLIPTGAKRHDVSSLHMEIAGSIIDFVGSNSPSQIADNRCSVVEQDETDKFNDGTVKEAGASYLADERTKGVPGAKKYKASSPTLVSGLIWQELLKTNINRYFMPCPHCSKHVVFSWSKQFTVLPLIGCEAFIRWDKEARREDGTWDLDRVVRSSRMACPHCGGHIRDNHKNLMDKLGEWRPTQIGAPLCVGRHLPSMYAPSESFGLMAKKFLLSKRSVEGLRGFINSDLAEPDIGQEVSVKRVELIISKFSPGDWKHALTVDVQQKAPYFWWVDRGWKPNACHGFRAGSAETYEEIREIQLKNQKDYKIDDKLVWIDSGFRARSGDAEVYRNCAEYGQLIPNGDTLEHVGWMPTKGFPSSKRWTDKETKERVPYYCAPLDPFLGTEDAGKVSMVLFEFSSDYFKDLLDGLRTRRTTFARKFEWSVADNIMEDMQVYWRHMDGQHKVTNTKRNGYQTVEWKPRGQYWPDHLFACEYLQIAVALFNNWFALEEVNK